MTYIPGDGIGRSIVESARRVIDATGADIEWREARAGETLHAETVPSCSDIST